jgi:cation diffusion facilitator family transporter
MPHAAQSASRGPAAASFSGTVAPVDYSREKRAVSRNSMIAAAAMTLLKLVAGVISGSLAVLSDAAHSGLDLAGAALTFFSVRVSDKPADEDHPYGHGKIENLSAFTEAGLMGVSCAWIIFAAMRRILNHGGDLRLSPWPIAVVVASICVDFWRSRKLRAVAVKTGSPALATDAAHFSSDIWASLAVLVGLLIAWVGDRIGKPSFHYADPVAAIVVSLLILRMTIHLGHEAVSVLTDEIPAETRNRITRDVESVDGVLAVEQARVRRAGANYFADFTLALPRNSTFEHTGAMVEAARAAVRRTLPTADVVIHTVPRESRAESIFDRVRAVAARNNVSVHEVSVQSNQGHLRVEQHLELDENLTLLSAHDFVTAIEAQILRAVPEIDSVLTHIESEPATIELPLVESNRRIEMSLLSTAAELTEVIDVHDIVIGHSAEHTTVSCHCTLPDSMDLRRVHIVITELEDRFKLVCPEVQRVTIHPEPVTDNLR